MRLTSNMKNNFAAFIAIVASATLAASTTASDPAEHLVAIAQQADAVTIEFYSPSGKEEVAFTDIFWVERLATVLAFSSYKPQDHCLCVSYPTIRLIRKQEIIGTLSVHHGEKLRAYAGEVSGDFIVGARTGKAIVDLANEKRKGNQLPKRNAGGGPPSDDSSASEPPSSFGPRE